MQCYDQTQERGREAEKKDNKGFFSKAYVQEIAEKYEGWLIKGQEQSPQTQVSAPHCRVSFPNFYSQPPFTRDIVITTSTGQLDEDYKNFREIIIKLIKKSCS